MRATVSTSCEEMQDEDWGRDDPMERQEIIEVRGTHLLCMDIHRHRYTAVVTVL